MSIVSKPNALQVRIVSVCRVTGLAGKRCFFLPSPWTPSPLCSSPLRLTSSCLPSLISWGDIAIIFQSHTYWVSSTLTWFFFLRLPLNLCSCFWSGSELLGKSSRVTFSLIGHCFGYALGYALLPLLAYFIRSWRRLLVASAVPSLLFLPLWWWVMCWQMFVCWFLLTLLNFTFLNNLCHHRNGQKIRQHQNIAEYHF